MSLSRMAARIGGGIMLLALLAASPTTSAFAQPFTASEVNEANFDGAGSITEERSPVILRLQVLLDRSRFSPGVIDGRAGGNTSKALSAYAEENGLGGSDELTTELWDRLTAADPEPVVETYRITPEDLDQPFVEEIPDDYAKLAKMERLSYTGPDEMLAERFHMDIDLLKALNPEADFAAEGTEILVARVGTGQVSGEVRNIVASRSGASVRAYDADGRLVAFYTATLGSEQTPSPSGTHEVEAIVTEPNYTYRPDVNFRQGELDEALVLPPGPNNPVGTIWIDLSEPTYGIHGTPEPAAIDKVYSHGCVRLTNWDAEELAELVVVGAIVEFVD